MFRWLNWKRRWLKRKRQLDSNPTLQAAERDHILRVLRETKGQIGGSDGAAERLGLKRTTLNSKTEEARHRAQ